MTRRAFGMPCSWPSDGVITPPAGQPPGPGPSGGHEKHPGLAANAADLCFSAAPLVRYSKEEPRPRHVGAIIEGCRYKFGSQIGV